MGVAAEGAGGWQALTVTTTGARMTERRRDVEAARRDGALVDTVLVEEPLTVQVAAGLGPATPVWTTLRTPGCDLDLALGWTLAEGLVTGIHDVLDVHHCTDGGVADPNSVTVRLARAELPALDGLRRSAASTPACGLCGRDELHAVLRRCPPAPRNDVATTLDALDGLAAQVRGHQPLFDATGGSHAAATATADGRLLHVREDVGRHNAVDAAFGATLRGPTAADVLLLSGRAGFELVAKAVAGRVAVVASVGAATALAVDTAAAAGLTLVTFLGRSHGGTVLTRPDRLGLGVGPGARRGPDATAAGHVHDADHAGATP